VAKIPARTPVRIGQVVQRRRRPDQVDRVDVGPRLIQVRLDGADPVGRAENAGLAAEAVQHFRRQVEGDHLGRLEPLEQGEGAGAGSAAQVEDPARRQIGGQLADPGGHLGQVGVHDLGVEVQELGQGRVGLGGGVIGVVGVVGVALVVLVVLGMMAVLMAFHARQPTYALRY
jgi:hypothetical protein